MPQKRVNINVIGSNTVGYVGEKADELLITESFRKLGHPTTMIPRDIWKAYAEGVKPNDDWVLPKEGISIICKWHHFNELHVQKLKDYGPVIYWTWDWMQWPNPPIWHAEMVGECDLHLTNDAMSPGLTKYSNVHYFPMDVADGNLKVYESNKEYDVVFFGSHLQQGDRVEWIQKINEYYPVRIYSWNYQEWQKLGLDAHEAVYGDSFNEVVSRSKICLQFSVNDHIWGYWSNRVGKVLTAGGFLLARYAPGMELFIRDGADYFTSPEEAIKKIGYYLEHPAERNEIRQRGHQYGKDRFTMDARIKELVVILEKKYGEIF